MSLVPRCCSLRGCAPRPAGVPRLTALRVVGYLAGSNAPEETRKRVETEAELKCLLTLNFQTFDNAQSVTS